MRVSQSLASKTTNNIALRSRLRVAADTCRRRGRSNDDHLDRQRGRRQLGDSRQLGSRRCAANDATHTYNVIIPTSMGSISLTPRLTLSGSAI